MERNAQEGTMQCTQKCHYHPKRQDCTLQALRQMRYCLSGLPNANAKSPRFSYAIPQIAPLPPLAALNRNFNTQIAARYAAFWNAISQIALASSFSAPKSQRFKSQRLQHANATKLQTLAFYKSLRFSATKGIADTATDVIHAVWD